MVQIENLINTIQLGNCYELIKQIPNKSVDLIITVPPYEIGKGGMTGIFKYRKKRWNNIRRN